MRMTAAHPSHAIEAFGYDAERRELGVRFCGEAEWVYEGVPAEAYALLRASRLPGKMFNTLIRGGGFKGRRVDAA